MKLLTLNTHSLIEPDYEAKREAFVDFIAEEQPEEIGRASCRERV